MSIRISSLITAAALVAAVPVFGQGRGGYQPPTGSAPKAADGHPDFSGLWQRPYTPDMSLTATDLNGKAYPLENPPACSMTFLKGSRNGVVNTLNPQSTAFSMLGALIAANHIGGCGFCIGRGVMVVAGNL